MKSSRILVTVIKYFDQNESNSEWFSLIKKNWSLVNSRPSQNNHVHVV